MKMMAVLLRTSNLKKALACLAIIPVFALAGCTPPSATVQQAAPSAAAPAAPTGPSYVEGKGYHFKWEQGMSGVVTIPVSIKEQALEACIKQGFTTTYMSSIAFTDGAAEGYFNCRGSGGN